MRVTTFLPVAGLSLLLGFAVLAEPVEFSAKVSRIAWTADWNARVDAHLELLDHPCGDYAFDPWADAFLESCQGKPETRPSKLECEVRTDWVWERSRQCNVWQTWLLRNHRKHQRSKAKEPETRVK